MICSGCSDYLGSHFMYNRCSCITQRVDSWEKSRGRSPDSQGRASQYRAAYLVQSCVTSVLQSRVSRTERESSAARTAVRDGGCDERASRKICGPYLLRKFSTCRLNGRRQRSDFSLSVSAALTNAECRMALGALRWVSACYAL